jgi:gamma-glutamyl-gamma-aminobutyrate hydrolase PuuD
MRTPPLPPPGRPRIGIPVRLSCARVADPRVGEANELFTYIVGLVREGGGEPVLLTPDPDGGSGVGRLAETLKGLAGVVLPGGGDLDPRLYGEEPGAACYDLNFAQDALDVAVARGTIDAGLPLLGICRGHQLLNVQAVARVADGLMVTAVASDGTVEALEDPVRWVASVQWHPEVRELPAEQRVAPFRAFVAACYYRQKGSMSYQENIG